MAALDVGELLGEGSRGGVDLVGQQEHRRELDCRLRHLKGAAKSIALGSIEGAKDDNHVHVRGGAEGAFGGAAVENHRRQLVPERVASGAHEVGENARNVLWQIARLLAQTLAYGSAARSYAMRRTPSTGLAEPAHKLISWSHSRDGRGRRPFVETILLVDDEADVLATAREMLEGQGYEILDALNAEEAVRVAAAHHGPSICC